MIILLGAKIRTLRKAKGYTQEQLGALIDTTESYVGQIERGTKNVTVETIEKIATALDVNIRVLFDYQGLPAHHPRMLEIFELLKGRGDDELQRVINVIQNMFPK